MDSNQNNVNIQIVNSGGNCRKILLFLAIIVLLFFSSFFILKGDHSNRSILIALY